MSRESRERIVGEWIAQRGQNDEFLPRYAQAAWQDKTHMVAVD